MDCTKQWLFLLGNSFKLMSLENSSNYIWVDWVWNGGVDVFCGLNSIGSLACQDLSNDMAL